MIEYSVLDEQGKLIRSGTCQEHLFEAQAINPGERVVEGIIVEETEPDILHHGPLRKAEYPPIEQFADAMYWASRGNPIPLEQYYTQIDEIKRKIPKNVPI